jgi:hypothetical protein
MTGDPKDELLDVRAYRVWDTTAVVTMRWTLEEANYVVKKFQDSYQGEGYKPQYFIEEVGSEVMTQFIADMEERYGKGVALRDSFMGLGSVIPDYEIDAGDDEINVGVDESDPQVPDITVRTVWTAKAHTGRHGRLPR